MPKKRSSKGDHTTDLSADTTTDVDKNNSLDLPPCPENKSSRPQLYLNNIRVFIMSIFGYDFRISTLWCLVHGTIKLVYVSIVLPADSCWERIGKQTTIKLGFETAGEYHSEKVS